MVNKKMDELTSLTAELKEALSVAIGENSKGNLVLQHIENVEKNEYTISDFPSDLDWFNTSEPLSRDLLKGKIVVLDFFTYCCINCLHVIPHLRQLERKYSVEDGLVVIGVHSAKFDNERDSRNILSALKRYNISHPVVNDKHCYLWNKLNICCWPTILILNPQGKPLFVLVGEEHRDELLLFIEKTLKYYKCSVSPHKLPLVKCDTIVTSNLLSFPGKISRWKNSLAISDSGNHRIIVGDTNGNIKFKIGGNTPGFKDGSFGMAQFNSPQGLTFYDSNTIYVADTDNHAIRLINLVTLEVTTVVGNGNQGTDYVGGKIGTLQEISSPWDVCLVPCSAITNTGLNRTVLGSGDKAVFSPPSTSNTKSRCVPPSPPSPPALLPFNCQFPPPPPPPPPLPSSLLLTTDSPCPPFPFELSTSIPHSQPSEKSNLNDSSSKVLLIAVAGTHQIWAYFIESSIWWKGKKHEKNTCIAIAGTGKEENRNNYYPLRASFAQPSGLTYSEQLQSVFIADSESSSIRKLSLRDGSVTHLAGGTQSPDDLFSYGDKDEKGYKAKFQHPLGVAWDSKRHRLYVTDTYNHKIKEINASDGNSITIHEDSHLFNEPGGCCLDESEDVLYVADTNNNAIKMISLSNKQVKKFNLEEKSENLSDTGSESLWEAEAVLPKAGGALTISIEFFPGEIHGKCNLNFGESKVKLDNSKGKITSNVFEVQFTVLQSEVDDILKMSFDLVLCGNEICCFKKTELTFIIKRREIAEKNVVAKLSKKLV